MTDEMRLNKVESQMYSIFSIGGFVALMASIFGGLIESIGRERHKENVVLMQSLVTNLQNLQTSVAVLEARIGEREHQV